MFIPIFFLYQIKINIIIVFCSTLSFNCRCDIVSAGTAVCRALFQLLVLTMHSFVFCKHECCMARCQHTTADMCQESHIPGAWFHCTCFLQSRKPSRSLSLVSGRHSRTLTTSCIHYMFLATLQRPLSMLFCGSLGE